MGRVHVAPHSQRMLCCLFLESFLLFCYVVLLCLPVGFFSGCSDSKILFSARCASTMSLVELPFSSYAQANSSCFARPRRYFAKSPGASSFRGCLATLAIGGTVVTVTSTVYGWLVVDHAEDQGRG